VPTRALYIVILLIGWSLCLNEIACTTVCGDWGITGDWDAGSCQHDDEELLFCVHSKDWLSGSVESCRERTLFVMNYAEHCRHKEVNLITFAAKNNARNRAQVCIYEVYRY
jgi:hypothetical protein